MRKAPARAARFAISETRLGKARKTEVYVFVLSWFFQSFSVQGLARELKGSGDRQKEGLMPFRLTFRASLTLLLVGLTGCAAPIKALMGEPVPLLDQAGTRVASDEEARLRLALMEKGQALLKARGGHPAATEPSTVQFSSLDKRSPVHKFAPGAATAPRDTTPAVSAMLARARMAEAPRPTSSPPAAPQPDLTRAIRVKDETRFQASPTGSLARKPNQVLVRFAPGATALDGEGNRALAELARRSELAPDATIVLVAGLSGPGSPWERMQAASERLEVIARHVPPPLKVERRFEIELESQSVRLELHHEAR